MRLKYLVLVVIIVLVAIQPAPKRGQAQDPYEQLVRRALSELGTNCANLGRNSACLGFPDVVPTFVGEPPEEPFEEPGDRADLLELESLLTPAIDLLEEIWGVSVINMQGNIPLALGQSPVYVMLGDAEIIDEVAPGEAFIPPEPVDVTTTAQTDVLKTHEAGAEVLGTVPAGTVLQADGITPDGQYLRVLFEDETAEDDQFYIGWIARAAVGPDAPVSGLPLVTEDSKGPFQVLTLTTGIGLPPSPAVPPDVLIVQSPEDMAVEIVVNCVPMKVEGVVFLRTPAEGELQIATVIGEVTVFPDTLNEIVVVAGTSVIIEYNCEEPEESTCSFWRVLGQDEWDAFSSVEIITNVWAYDYEFTLPRIVIASGVGGVTITVETLEEIITPVAPGPICEQ